MKSKKIISQVLSVFFSTGILFSTGVSAESGYTIKRLDLFKDSSLFANDYFAIGHADFVTISSMNNKGQLAGEVEHYTRSGIVTGPNGTNPLLLNYGGKIKVHSIDDNGLVIVSSPSYYSDELGVWVEGIRVTDMNGIPVQNHGLSFLIISKSAIENIVVNTYPNYSNWLRVSKNGKIVYKDKNNNILISNVDDTDRRIISSERWSNFSLSDNARVVHDDYLTEIDGLNPFIYYDPSIHTGFPKPSPFKINNQGQIFGKIGLDSSTWFMTDVDGKDIYLTETDSTWTNISNNGKIIGASADHPRKCEGDPTFGYAGIDTPVVIDIKSHKIKKLPCVGMPTHINDKGQILIQGQFEGGALKKELVREEYCLSISYPDENDPVFNENHCWSFNDSSYGGILFLLTPISPKINLTPVLLDNYIDSIQISFPLEIETEGDYSVTFRMTDSTGEEIESFTWSSHLTVGMQTVKASVDAEEIRHYDGPYKVESVVVTGPDGSDAIEVEQDTTFYSRWQYHPGAKPADLDGNGVVDQADKALLMSQRNLPVYSPGDRRDLNRDGKIDLKDVMLLQQMGN